MGIYLSEKTNDARRDLWRNATRLQATERACRPHWWAVQVSNLLPRLVSSRIPEP